jgi:signal transduction histidine kinase
VHWSLECQQRLTGIPEEMAVAAFRITQEAVTNMLRHAQAHNLLIRLQRLPEGLSLLSATTARVFACHRPRPGRPTGMAGMFERIDQLGGIVRQQPAGQRTRIEALFPGRPAPSNGPVPLRFSSDL